MSYSMYSILVVLSDARYCVQSIFPSTRDLKRSIASFSHFNPRGLTPEYSQVYINGHITKNCTFKNKLSYYNKYKSYLSCMM